MSSPVSGNNIFTLLGKLSCHYHRQNTFRNQKILYYIEYSLHEHVIQSNFFPPVVVILSLSDEITEHYSSWR